MGNSSTPVWQCAGALSLALAFSHPNNDDDTYNSQFNLLSMSRVRSFNIFVFDDGTSNGNGTASTATPACITRTTFLFHNSCVSDAGRAGALAHFPLRISDTMWAETNLFAFDYILYHFFLHFSLFAFLSIFIFFRRFHFCAKYFVFRQLLVWRGEQRAALHTLTHHIYFFFVHFDLFDFPFGYSPDGIEFPLCSVSVSLPLTHNFFSFDSRSGFYWYCFVEIVFLVLLPVASSAFLLYAVHGVRGAFSPIPHIHRCRRRYGCESEAKWISDWGSRTHCVPAKMNRHGTPLLNFFVDAFLCAAVAAAVNL